MTWKEVSQRVYERYSFWHAIANSPLIPADQLDENGFVDDIFYLKGCPSGVCAIAPTAKVIEYFDRTSFRLFEEERLEPVSIFQKIQDERLAILQEVQEQIWLTARPVNLPRSSRRTTVLG